MLNIMFVQQFNDKLFTPLAKLRKKGWGMLGLYEHFFVFPD